MVGETREKVVVRERRARMSKITEECFIACVVCVVVCCLCDDGFLCGKLFVWKCFPVRLSQNYSGSSELFN